jgi:hypothetical protein
LPKVSLYLSVKREDEDDLRMLGLVPGFIMRETCRTNRQTPRQRWQRMKARRNNGK